MLTDVHIVLLRPQGAANVGAVARAMKNFGLSRLSLVDARLRSFEEARRMAVHAEEVLAASRHHPTLDAAVAGASWVVATTHRPPAGMRVLTPAEVAAEVATHGPPTLVFGGEQHGLYPGEMLRCHAAASIPVVPEQSSLNLAQAVCVFAAELFRQHGGDRRAPLPTAAAASPEWMARLESALAGFLGESAWTDADRGKHALAELVQPFWRARATEAEVRAWLVALGKAAQRPRR